MVFLTLFAAIITADKTKKAPKLAAIGKDQLEMDAFNKKPPKIDEPKISNATPKLAPDEIPKTKGPANGFLKSVCINKPQIDKPEPTKTAVIAFGNLKVSIMVSQVSLVGALPIKVVKISLNGMETDPKLMFKINKTTSKTDNKINGVAYFFCSILLQNLKGFKIFEVYTIYNLIKKQLIAE